MGPMLIETPYISLKVHTYWYTLYIFKTTFAFFEIIILSILPFNAFAPDTIDKMKLSISRKDKQEHEHLVYVA